jgi:hypothetical protein
MNAIVSTRFEAAASPAAEPVVNATPATSNDAPMNSRRLVTQDPITDTTVRDCPRA